MPWDLILAFSWLTLNKLPPFSKMFIAKLEHVFVSWDLNSHGKPFIGAYGRIFTESLVLDDYFQAI